MKILPIAQKYHRIAKQYLVREVRKVDTKILKSVIRRFTPSSLSPYLDRLLPEEASAWREEFPLDALPVITYKIDINGRFTHVNEAVKMLGYKPDELIGEHFSRIVHPEDIEKSSLEGILRRYRGKKTGDKGSPGIFNERRARDRAKKTKRLELRLVPKGWNKEDDSGVKTVSLESWRSWGKVAAAGYYGGKQRSEFLGTVGIIQDITDQRQAEEALREAEFEKMQLEKIAKRKAHMAHLGEGAAAVAHDYNGLLQPFFAGLEAVRTSLEELRSGIEEGLGDGHPLLGKIREIVQDLTKIRRACEHMQRENQRLLKFGKQDVERGYFSPNDAIDAAVGLARLKYKSKLVIMETRLENSIGSLYGDERAFTYDVLLNLLNNALDATQKEGRVLISSKKAGSGILIEVSDTGQGIPEDVQPRIFEKYFTTKSQEEGTGLGMDIIKRGIEEMGGTIAFKSKVGKGTTFCLFFPLESEIREEAESLLIGVSDRIGSKAVDEGIGEIDGIKGKALIIEDDRAICDMLKKYLSKLGFLVITTETAREGEELFEMGEFNLVITDQVLPDGKLGTEVAREIKGKKPETRIIISSGYTSNEDIKAGANEGVVDEILWKPYPMDVLKAALEKLGFLRRDK